MALLAGAVGLTLALAAVGARVTVVSASSKARMTGTLGRASLEQMEFRAANKRFALWEELVQRGATLPDQLEVVATNASSSHWFLKVRDRQTGIACSRVGELLDAPGLAVAPVCDRASQ